MFLKTVFDSPILALQGDANFGVKPLFEVRLLF